MNLFLSFIHDIISYENFNDKLSSCILTTIQIGNIFEIFIKEFIEHIYYRYIPNYHKYLMFKELTKMEKESFILPLNDKGSDGIILADEPYIVQIKFRSNRDKIICYGDKISNFIGLLSSSTIRKGYYFTNCYSVCSELKTCHNIIIVNDFSGCDIHFWNSLRKNQIIPISNPVQLYNHQQQAINTICQKIGQGGKCRVVLFCGTGKTLISIYTIIQLKIKSFIVIVPYLSLLSQIVQDYRELINGDYLQISSNIDGTTKHEKIINYLDTHNGCEKIFVTYMSHNIIHDILSERHQELELCIFDEAHHCITEGNGNLNLFVSNPMTKRSLYMTATEKISHTDISMNNEKYFGSLVYEYNCRQAIDDGIICDVEFIIAVSSKKDIPDIINNNIDNQLLLSADISLNFLGDTSHLNKKMLAFSNNRCIAQKLYNLVVQRNNLTDIHLDYLDGLSTMTERQTSLKRFHDSEYGFLSTINIFNEGLNEKGIDSALSNLVTSRIKFVQRLGRIVRLDYKGKLGRMIIPYVIHDYEDLFSLHDRKLFKFFTHIIEDLGYGERIWEKIKFKRVKYGSIHDTNYQKDHIIMLPEISDDQNFLDDIYLRYHNFQGHDLRRTEYKLLQRKVKRLGITTKNQYRHIFGYDKDDPIKKYPEFFKNWYKFLGIDTSKFPQTYQQWKNEIQKYIITSNSQENYELYLQHCDELNLPYMPEEIYSEIKIIGDEFIPKVIYEKKKL